MNPPSFQEHLLPATLKTNLDLYEHFVPGEGWKPVEDPGHYQRVRELVPGWKHDLDSVHDLEQCLIPARFSESKWIRAIDEACNGSGPARRANVNQRLRALARLIEGGSNV